MSADLTVPPPEVWHELKCWPDYFAESIAGRKPFEIRKDDRGFKISDGLLLRGFNFDSGTYSGRECRAVVTCITEYTPGLKDGYVVLGLAAYPLVRKSDADAALASLQARLEAAERDAAALAIRLQMAAEGWHSEDRLSDIGWGKGKLGYSIWFERYDWHGQYTLKINGSKACYHSHTPDLSKIAEVTKRAAERARRAWREFPDVHPQQGVNGELVPGQRHTPRAATQEAPAAPSEGSQG